MKAFLLAAGYGTRLKPITDKVPKCLVPIGGVPLLGWWLRLFKYYGIEEVLVNTHYLPDQVKKYVDQYNKEHGHFVKLVHEETLLGSGGTLRANQAFIPEGESFLICYADNLTDINLKRMIEKHREQSGLLTMALFHTNKPRQCGIAETDESGKIVSFVEKPENPRSSLANAGIYAADYELMNILQAVKPGEVLDLGKDVLPGLGGVMYAYFMSEYLIDIGTLDNYERAQREWKHDYNQNAFSD